MENETDRKRWSKKYVSNVILYGIDTEFRYGFETIHFITIPEVDILR